MASLPWFRMYAEAVDDEKLRLLDFADRWHFVALLCCKCKGLFDTDDDWERLQRKLALKLEVSVSELPEIHRRLSEEGLVDERMEPNNWDKRQFKSDHDPTGAERQKRHRESQRRNALRNGAVTDSARVGADTETDTDKPTAHSGRRRNEYTAEFEQAWEARPKRHGDNPKPRAFKAWNARLREGHTAEEMTAGVQRYAKWCKATGKEGTEHVKQLATLLGPDQGFGEPWETENQNRKDDEVIY